MINSQNENVQNLLPPAAIVNNAAFTINVLDTIGYDYVDIYLVLGALDIALAVCKLNESDVKGSSTTLTSGTLVPGSDYSVSPATLPAATDDNHIFVWRVNCNGPRKRYLLPAVTMGNGSTGGFATIIAVLGRADQMPSTAAGRGLTQELFC